MRLLAINASYRGSQGYTQFLIDRLFADVAECETVVLARLKINHCLGCEQCQAGGRKFRCVYDGKDDARRIFEKIAAADCIIYATPVYIFAMSGLLKTLLERIYGICDSSQMRVSQHGLLFHHIDAQVCSKPFVPLVCCDNLENETPKNILAYFKTFSRFMDAPQVGTLVRSGGRLAGHGKDPDRLERFPRLKKIYAAYEQAGRELAREGRIHGATQRAANQEFLPVPGFGLLKRIPFKPLKEVFARKAREMQA